MIYKLEVLILGSMTLIVNIGDFLSYTVFSLLIDGNIVEFLDLFLFKFLLLDLR